MSLHLVWKGQKRHQLDPKHNYRYIYPSHAATGLSKFYGDDCSFCQGILFDTTDFIIEFIVNQWTGIESIEHHHNSYRGHISRDNTSIVGMYVKKHPLDYNKTEFNQHFKTLVAQVPIGTKIYQYTSCDDLTDHHVILTSILVKSDVIDD